MGFWRKRNGCQPKKTSLESLLIEAGYISKEKLDRLVQEFHARRQDRLLGQYLVDRGAITFDQLELSLLRQTYSRGKTPSADTIAQARKISAKRHSLVQAELSEIGQLTASLINGGEPKSDPAL